jgi:hypothetical protein
MKTYCGSGGTVPRFLYLGTRWRWVVSFTPRPIYPLSPQGKGPWYALDRRLGVHLEPVLTWWRREIFQDPAENRNLESWSSCPLLRSCTDWVLRNLYKFRLGTGVIEVGTSITPKAWPPNQVPLDRDNTVALGFEAAPTGCIHFSSG